ncbi:MAG: DUF2330 domain-containing protein [Alphaproteobacteria bacterium]|nr:DUF2330 domain-containing protein [Alphaproteobacteria bacterium]
MKKLVAFFVLALLASPASALPGFFVGSDENGVTVPSTKIIIASHQNHQVLTVMPSLVSTEKELAFLMPLPLGTTRENIRTLSPAAFDALDKLSAPRLVEVTDPNPCTRTDGPVQPKTITSATYNTTLDASYDISILDRASGQDLLPWLEKNGYKLPPKAEQIIEPYTQRGTVFALIKLHRNSTGNGLLPPIQISYDAPKIILPLRLGLVNRPKMIEPPKAGKEAIVYNSEPDRTNPQPIKHVDIFNDGAQAVTLYVLTQYGIATSPLMRSVQLENTRNEVFLPTFAADHFTDIVEGIKNFRAKAESNAMILEYAGIAGNADVPDALLQSIGVSWLNEAPAAPVAGQVTDTANNDNLLNNNLLGGMLLPKAAYPKHLRAQASANGKAYLTRLYLRYMANALPQDLLLQESQSQQNIATAYHVQHPWVGGSEPKDSCQGAALYQQSVQTRETHALETLTRLTGLSASALAEKFTAQGAK